VGVAVYTIAVLVGNGVAVAVSVGVGVLVGGGVSVGVGVMVNVGLGVFVGVAVSPRATRSALLQAIVVPMIKTAAIRITTATTMTLFLISVILPPVSGAIGLHSSALRRLALSA
jgi:hypothetical protein